MFKKFYTNMAAPINELCKEFISICFGWLLIISALYDVNNVQAATALSPLSSTGSGTERSLRHLNFKALHGPSLDPAGGQWATAQDAQGFLWFAGDKGLVRYDGYEYRLYRHQAEDDTSLSNSSVRSLFLDSRKRLWVLTARGLNLYQPDFDNFKHYFLEDDSVELLSYLRFVHMMEDHEGQLWVATDGAGVHLFYPGTGEFKRFGELPDNIRFIQYLFEDNKNNVWIGSSRSGLVKYNRRSNEITHYAPNPEVLNQLSHHSVTNIIEYKPGDIWVGTYGGINRLDEEKGTFRRYNFDPNNASSLGANVIHQMILDKQGKLLIAADGGGLNLYRPEHDNFLRYTQKHGLINNKTRSVFQDNSGELWIGHFPAGISQLDRHASTFHNYLYSEIVDGKSLSNSDIRSVAEDRAGNLWVGTERGLNFIDRSMEKVTQYIHDPNDPTTLSAHPTLSVFVDSTDTVWAGTWGGGLNRFEPESQSFKKYEIFKDKTVNGKLVDVWSIYEDRFGRLWIGTEDGMVQYDREKDVLTNFINSDTLEDYLPGQAVAMQEDASGNYWVASNNGLNVINPDGKAKHFQNIPGDPNSLSNNFVNDIFQDAQGNIWVATMSGGVVIYDENTDKFKSDTRVASELDESVSCVIQAKDGALWFGTGQGLLRYDRENGEVRNYTIEYGLPGNSFRRSTCIKLKSGELVFGTTKGLTIFDVDDLIENTVAPPVVITDFQIFFKPVEVGVPGSPLTKKISKTEKVILSHNHQVFSLQFSALNYQMPEKNNYAYMLQGFDKDWVYSGTRRAASYTNLDPGRYVFKVKASNNEGVWNTEGASLEIRVKAPPWKSWWAYCIYLLVVLLIVFRYICAQKSKQRFVEQQNKLLESKVTERTLELFNRNQAIQAMLSHMRQGLFSIGPEGVIENEYSRYLSLIFETDDIAGRSVIDVLFSSCELSAERVSQIEAALTSAVEQNMMNYEVNRHLLVTEYDVLINNATKTLSLDWNPVVDGEIVRKIIVTVRDVTALRTVEVEAKSHKRELDIIDQIIHASDKSYQQLEEATQRYLEEIRALLKSEEIGSEGFSLIFRNLHNIKGNSRTMGFSFLSEAAHKVENYCIKLRQEKNLQKVKKDIAEQLEIINNCLNEYANVYHIVLNFGGNKFTNRLDCSVVENQLIRKVQDYFVSMSQSNPGLLSHAGSKDVLNLFNQTLYKPINEMIGDVINSLPFIAKQLGKESPIVKLDVCGIRINNSCEDVLISIFTHLLGNCLDHGIESPDERAYHGKQKSGTINVGSQVSSESIDLIIYDDGRGLNIKSLFQKGVSLKRWDVVARPNISEIASLIFLPGLTTKEEVTSISGRGVGMDSVRALLIESGCDIRIEVADRPWAGEDYVVFETVITIPNSLYVLV